MAAATAIVGIPIIVGSALIREHYEQKRDEVFKQVHEENQAKQQPARPEDGGGAHERETA